jgi:hypothetical protein
MGYCEPTGFMKYDEFRDQLSVPFVNCRRKTRLHGELELLTASTVKFHIAYVRK